MAEQVEVKDQRIRLRPRPNELDLVYGSGSFRPTHLLNPLRSTGGLIFPYKPNVTIPGTVDVAQHPLAAANQDYHIYQRTQAHQIQIVGNFTAQTIDQAKYALAVIHFLRTITKIHFGENSKAGNNGVTDASNQMNPPPKLLLSGYGEYIFNDVPVNILNYTIDFNNQINYIPVFTEEELVNREAEQSWVPTNFTVSLSLVSQVHPSKWNYVSTKKEGPNRGERFNWDKFANGSLFKNGGWM